MQCVPEHSSITPTLMLAWTTEIHFENNRGPKLAGGRAQLKRQKSAMSSVGARLCVPAPFLSSQNPVWVSRATIDKSLYSDK